MPSRTSVVSDTMLTILPDGPMAFDGGRYFTTKGEGLYIEEIAKHFKRIIVCSYFYTKHDPYFRWTCEFEFTRPNIIFQHLPFNNRPRAGVISKIWQLCHVTRALYASMKSWDRLYLFLPGYPTAIAHYLNRLFFHKRYFVYIAGDWPGESNEIFRWTDWRHRPLGYPFRLLNGLLESAVLKRATFILAAGGFLYNKFKKLGVPIYQTLPRIDLNPSDVFQREDTCHGSRIELLFVGYLERRKGVDYLLEAIRNIRRREEYDVHLKLVGDGVDKITLERTSSDLGIQCHVEFLGHVSDKSALLNIYRSSDIFVLPTLGEGFPRVLYEAMSQCLPIIATRVGGIPFTLDESVHALLIDPACAGQIEEAVITLIRDMEFRRRLISNGLRFMRDLFGAGTAGKQVAELFEKHVG